jgi:hypothetical protein
MYCPARSIQFWGFPIVVRLRLDYWTVVNLPRSLVIANVPLIASASSSTAVKFDSHNGDPVAYAAGSEPTRNQVFKWHLERNKRSLFRLSFARPPIKTVQSALKYLSL